MRPDQLLYREFPVELRTAYMDAVRATDWSDRHSGRPLGTAKDKAKLHPRPTASEGRGIAPGTCGEFVQGVLPDGTPVHVTCPINKSATVVAQLRAAGELSIAGLGEHHRKLGLALGPGGTETMSPSAMPVAKRLTVTTRPIANRSYDSARNMVLR